MGSIIYTKEVVPSGDKKIVVDFPGSEPIGRPLPKHKSTLKWDFLCEPLAVRPISPVGGVGTDLAGESPWGTRSVSLTLLLKVFDISL